MRKIQDKRGSRLHHTWSTSIPSFRKSSIICTSPVGSASVCNRTHMIVVCAHDEASPLTVLACIVVAYKHVDAPVQCVSRTRTQYIHKRFHERDLKSRRTRTRSCSGTDSVCTSKIRARVEKFMQGEFGWCLTCPCTITSPFSHDRHSVFHTGKLVC